MTTATAAEIREWIRGLGLPVAARGSMPEQLLDRWDREHPDRPAPRATDGPPPVAWRRSRDRRTSPQQRDLSWHAAAACAGHPDPNAFHHPPTDGTGRRHIEQIIADYCLACPVRAECLAAVLALAGFDRWGTWGGVHWRGPARPSDPHLLLPDDVAAACGIHR
jgi:hypothetical protein